MALVGYSIVILCCIFVENVLEVEEESAGKLYFHTLLNAILTGTFQSTHIRKRIIFGRFL